MLIASGSLAKVIASATASVSHSTSQIDSTPALSQIQLFEWEKVIKELFCFQRFLSDEMVLWQVDLFVLHELGCGGQRCDKTKQTVTVDKPQDSSFLLSFRCLLSKEKSAFILPDRATMFDGLMKIWLGTCKISTNYFALGGFSATFLNMGIVGLICTALFFLPAGMAHAPNVHKGYDHYSAAVPIGMTAFFLRAVLYNVMLGKTPAACNTCWSQLCRICTAASACITAASPQR